MASHISSGHVTVTTSATLIYKSDADGTTLTVHNDQASPGNAVFVGGADVTASTGLQINAADIGEDFRIPPGLGLYGITSSSTTQVSYLAINH